MKIKNNDSSVLILETGTNNDKCPRLEFRREDSTISTSSIHMDSYGLVLSNSIESTTPGGGITFQTGGTNRGFYNAISRFQITKDGNFIPKTNKTYNIGSDGKKIKDVHVSGLFVSDSIILGEVPFKTIKSSGGKQSIFIGSSVPNITTSSSFNVAFGDSALLNLTGGNFNVAVGGETLKKETSGNDNIAVGYQVLVNSNTSTGNTGIGTQSLKEITTGNYNTSIGYQSLNMNQTGNGNVASGLYSLEKTTSGITTSVSGANIQDEVEVTYTNYGNVGYGTRSLRNNTSGQNNTAIGTASLTTNVIGKNNTALGAGSLEKSTGKNNLAIGFRAGDSIIAGDSNVVIGYQANVSTASANNQIVIGSRAIGKGDNTVVLGDSLTIKSTYLHGDININRKYTIPKVDGNKGNVLRTDGNGTVSWDSTSIDDLHDVLLKDSSVFLGTEPQSINNARHNTAVGIKVFNNVTNGKNNTIMGFNAANTLTTGDSNVVIGYEADVDNADALNRIVIGSRAIGFRDSTVVLGDSLTIQETFLHGNININREYIIPKSAGTSGQVLKYPTSGKTLEWGGIPDRINNLIDAKIEDSSIYLGTVPSNTNSTSGLPLRNTAVGFGALKNTTYGNKNVAVGYQTLYSNIDGSKNVANGYKALYSNTSGIWNVAIGDSALYNNKTGDENIAIGAQSLHSNIDGIHNIAYGSESLYYNKGSYNIATGFNSMYRNTTGNYNIALGRSSLEKNTKGHGNIAFGYRSLFYNNHGSNDSIGFVLSSGNVTDDNTPVYSKYGNIGIGVRAISNNKSGNNNIGIGTSTMDSTTTGSSNVAIGHGTMQNNTTGGHNTVIGFEAGEGLKTGDNNLIIGNHAYVDNANAQGQIVIGAIAKGMEDYSVVLGDSLTIQRTYLHGTVNIDRKYILPSTAGTSGQVLKYPATGKTLEWVTEIPNYSTITEKYLKVDAGNNLVWVNAPTVTGTGAAIINDLQDAKVDNYSLYFGTVPQNLATGQKANTGVGIDALNKITSGQKNTAIGYQALEKTTTGGWNIAIGNKALNKNLAGNDNTAIGNHALDQTLASFNTAIGSSALENNTTGIGNVATGFAALSSNRTQGIELSSGSLPGSGPRTYTNYGNVAYGARALYSNTTGNNNLAFGTSALDSSTTGDYNVAVGHGALEKNTTGARNIASGYQALHNNTTGTENLANGYQALYSNTTGNNNIASGFKALGSNTAGEGNVAIGYQALANNTTSGIKLLSGVLDGPGPRQYSGFGNIAYGTRALYSNTTGDGNVAIGTAALDSTTTGIFNTALGHRALERNTTGNENTALGVGAMEKNINGIQNTASGFLALHNNKTGFYNTASGYHALRSNTKGDGNVALGFRAGDSITEGDSNVIIGSQADISTGTGKNQIVIGAGAKGMGDSTVVLGDSLTIKTTYLHGDVDINRAYVLPKTAGTSGQILAYPATGNKLVWKEKTEITEIDVTVADKTSNHNYFNSSLTKLGNDIQGAAVGDRFGYSVSSSLDGKIVAIGGIIHDSEKGHVRIYEWNDTGSSWTQKGIDIDGEFAGDTFGNSVSLSSDGSTVAIGAILNDGNGNNSGHVRIYEFVGGSWTQKGADIDGAAADDWSGKSVSLSSNGSIVAIGAPYNNGFKGANSGHVRIFEYTSGSWSQKGADIDGEAAGDEFGTSVSLSSDGSIVAIGAPNNQSNKGHVQIYEWNGSTWQQKGSDLDGNTNEYAGYSVSLSSDGLTVAIGAYNSSSSGLNQSGTVRLYKWNGTAWTQKGSDINGEAANDKSGNSVSLSFDGSIVVIGSIKNSGKVSNSGHARIYEWNGTAWVQIGNDIDGNIANDELGFSVSLSSNGAIVAIGAPGQAGNSSTTGYVSLYSVNNTGSTKGYLLNGSHESPNLNFKTGNTYRFKQDDASNNTHQLRLFKDARKTIPYTAGVTYNGTAGTSGSYTQIVVTESTPQTLHYQCVNHPLMGYQISVSSGNFTDNLIGVNQIVIGSGVTTKGDSTVVIGDSLTIKTTYLHGDVDINRAYLLPKMAGTKGQVLKYPATGKMLEWGANESKQITELDITVKAKTTNHPYFDSSILLLGDDLDGEDAGDQFGRSISLSMDGNIIAIGAPNNDGASGSTTDNRGHVRIYEWNADSTIWSQKGNDIDGKVAGENSGTSVSLSDDGLTVVIGAPYNDGSSGSTTDDRGIVRIYQWNNGTSSWDNKGSDINGAAAGDRFGISVSISSDGNIVAIGAETSAGGAKGYVKIYQYDGSTWNMKGLKIDGEVANQKASIVSLSDDGLTVAIGAPGLFSGTAGAVRIYKWNGTIYAKKGNDIIGQNTADAFGFSVSLSSNGDDVAISAPNNDGNGANRGHVRIYRWNGFAWIKRGNDIEGKVTGEQLGMSISLSSNCDIVAIGGFNSNTDDPGRVRIYEWNNTDWKQVYIDIDGENLSDRFGSSVSLSSDGSRLAIGAFTNDGNGADSGHVRIYSLSKGYVINGSHESPLLNFKSGNIYRFKQDDKSNTNHQIKFYQTFDKTGLYETDVTYVGTPGSNGSYTEILVTESTPQNLFYQCVNHNVMGFKINFENENVTNTTNIRNNTVVLGNQNITNVYMAQNGKANIHSGGLIINNTDCEAVTFDVNWFYFGDTNYSTNGRIVKARTDGSDSTTILYNGENKAPTDITYLNRKLYYTIIGKHAIYVLDLVTNDSSVFVGNENTSGHVNDTGTAARFNEPTGITNDGTNLYVCDKHTHTIRKIVISSAVVTTIAGNNGNRGTTDGTGTAARFDEPKKIVYDGTDNLYILEHGRIRKLVISTTVVTTLSGITIGSGSLIDLTYLNNNLYFINAKNPQIIQKYIFVTSSVSDYISLGASGTTPFNSINNSAHHITNDGINLYLAESSSTTIVKIDSARNVSNLSNIALYGIQGLTFGEKPYIDLNTYSTGFKTYQNQFSVLNPGTEGQLKMLYYHTLVNASTMTVTVVNPGWSANATGQIAFTTLGETCLLQYLGGKWFAISSSTVTFA